MKCIPPSLKESLEKINIKGLSISRKKDKLLIYSLKPFKAYISYHWSIFNTDTIIKERSPFPKVAIKCEQTQKSHGITTNI